MLNLRHGYSTCQVVLRECFRLEISRLGRNYVSFDHESAGIDGGLRKRLQDEQSGAAAPMVVLYSRDLKATEEAVVAGGGSIVVPTFEFPGGRRFHFCDGVGNVLAVWSE